MISRKADISKLFSAFQHMKRADIRCGVVVAINAVRSSPDVSRKYITQVIHRQSQVIERRSETEKEKRTKVLAVVRPVVFYRWVRRTCPKLIATRNMYDCKQNYLSRKTKAEINISLHSILYGTKKHLRS